MKSNEKRERPRVHLHPLMWCIVGIVIFAALLFTAGFFVPPVGVIDGSLLKAVGELIALQAGLLAAYAIVSGKTATITHGNTSATIGADDGDKSND